MAKKSTIKLPLTPGEKARLRARKIKIADLADCGVDQLVTILDIGSDRARLIKAMAEFQSIPTLGFHAAEDIVFIGYYSLDELKGKDGAALTDEFESKKGYRIDPCVEDQFRTAVRYAETRDETLRWWDFTAERKKFRAEKGYPADRPKKEWFESPDYADREKKA